MAIIARLGDLISANLNALLDRVEDPELLLQKVVDDMEGVLAVARLEAARAITAERQLQRELERERSEAERWETRARVALQHQREDLARRALARKLEHDDIADALSRQYGEAQRVSDELKTALRALQSRSAEARRRQRLLSLGHRTARGRLDLQRAAVSLDLTGPMTRFARLENRLTNLRDELMAGIDILQIDGDLQDELDDLQSTRRIDEELKRLRGEAD
jgi:phage shock protein A